MHLNRLRPRSTAVVIHAGTSFLSTDQNGFVSGGEHGLYCEQTRFLSRLELRHLGLTPVSAVAVDSTSAVAFFLVPSPAGLAGGPPGGHHPSGGEIVEKGIEIRANMSLDRALRFEFVLTNHAMAEATFTLELAMDADFADLQEARTGKRIQMAGVDRAWASLSDGSGELTFRYQHPKLPHVTRICLEGLGRISPRPEGAAFTCTMAPRQAVTLTVTAVPDFLGASRETPLVASSRDADLDLWQRASARIECENPTVQAALSRAADDLFALRIGAGKTPARWTPIAGVPTYTALFGRDALVTSIQAAMLMPLMLEGSLDLVGRWTATKTDDRYDAQPGRVLHQRQRSPLALLGHNPFEHYYGDYSAPGWYVLGAALHYAHTADRGAFEAVRANVEATLAWMDRDGDLDGDGFYEYKTRAGKQGIKNQGWKDSGQAILYPDGGMVDDPIAVAEVQGLYYAAKQAIALTFMQLGEAGRASELLDQAAALKRRFNDRYWLPEEQFFALALDPDKRPVATIASDPGACLAYGIVDDDKAEAVARRLIAPDMFSGWGIRTLSSDHPAYNPFAYHLGTVWPMSNACIAFGLRRYGFDDACQRVVKAQIDATELFDFNRLPEVFSGHPREAAIPHPGLYPGACSPQAWSASAVWQMVQALLGVMPLAPIDTLAVDPALPDWLPSLTLRNLQVGQKRVDVRFERRADGRSEAEIVGPTQGLRLFRPTRAGTSHGDFVPALLVSVGH